MATRRTVLVGLGGLVAGTGALFATGAFTTVEAQRTVTIETAGDADAFLAFAPARDDEAFVDETSDGRIEINIDDTDQGGQGINRGARTRFENLVDITNQGTQTIIELAFEFDVDGADQDDDDVEDALRIVSGDSTIDATGAENLLEETDDGDADDDELSPGESIPFGIEIDLLDSNVEDITGDPEITLTITAEAEEQ